jgi:DNA-binding IclR family transcriptional regulator
VSVSSSATATMRSLDRAIDVLEVLEDAHTGLRLSEIARRADLHVATTQRILAALEARGRVERDDSRYRAGAALLFGAHAYLTASPLVSAARPILQDLASETGLASSVFVRTGHSRAIIARVEGSDPLRYELPVGERLPLHVGAGKVLAAQLEADEMESLIGEVAPFTTATGVEVTAEGLRAELEQVRARGFSLSYGERVLGSRSVAAPVRTREGMVVAAIQIAGTSESFPESRVEALSAAIRNAADALGRRL